MANITRPELDHRQKLLDEHVPAIRTAKAELDAARAAADEAELRYRQVIKEAFAAGLTVRPIHVAAGVSKDRCYQILHDRRT